MLGCTLAVTWALVALQAGGEAVTPQDQATYDKAQEAAGRDPDLNVRLALWCEQHGLRAERARHLGIAILAAPDHALAHAMLGLVQADGAWARPAQLAERVSNDEQRKGLLDEYAKRRAAARLTVDAQLELAHWCEKNGLTEQMRAHLVTVVKLDPSRDSTWKRLGYQKSNGRWMTPDQIDAAKADALAQKEANEKWKPALVKLRTALADPKTREAAREELARVDDPRAVPAVAAVFGSTADGLPVAVQLFGQIDDPSASQVLAWVAYAADDPEIRRVAIETLTQRDVREYAGPLVAMVRAILKYEVKPIQGPGSPGVLFVQGERFNLQRVYRAPTPPPPVRGSVLFGTSLSGTGTTPSAASWLPATPTAAPILAAALAKNPSQAPALIANIPASGASMAITNNNPLAPFAISPGGNPLELVEQGVLGERDVNGVTVAQANQMQQEATRRAAVATEYQLESDIAWVENENDRISRNNDRVLAILQPAAGTQLGADPAQWQAWWNQQVGVVAYDSYEPNITLTQVTDLSPAGYNFVPMPIPTGRFFTPPGTHGACFKAGTPVHTDRGLVAIEKLTVGDVVLSQDVATGSLSYEPILTVHHNPPAMIRRLVAGGQTVETTDLHRFWKVGTGWVMTRELKPGDEIRGLGGIVRVESNETGETVPVFNLDVDRSHSYFVGEKGILAHDHTLPDRRVKPFDRVDEQAIGGGSHAGADVLSAR